MIKLNMNPENKILNFIYVKVKQLQEYIFLHRSKPIGISIDGDWIEQLWEWADKHDIDDLKGEWYIQKYNIIVNEVFMKFLKDSPPYATILVSKKYFLSVFNTTSLEMINEHIEDEDRMVILQDKKRCRS